MAVMAKNIQICTVCLPRIQVRFVALLRRSSCRLKNFLVVCAAYNVT